MWRQNKKFIIWLLTGLLFTSCGFMDLRIIGVDLSPDGLDTVLEGEYDPVVISFDTAMKKSDAENALQVSYAGGVVEGDLSWKGDALCFVPAAGWKAGRRYAFSLSGLVYSLDGRELRLNRYVSFYAINKSPAPLVESFHPGDGASVGVNGDERCLVTLRFSEPMERLGTEAAFTITAPGEKKFEWQDDDRLLRVYSENPLAPWTVYRWSVSTNAPSRDGVPLAKALSAQFTTDEDRIFPEVVRAYPALQSGGAWIPSGGDLDEIGPGPGQGIAVAFNKVMGENVLRAIRFEPSLSGRTEQISGTTVVFIPSSDPEPETIYTLIVSGDTADFGGLKTGSDYRINFTPDIPFLRILSFTADGLDPAEDPADGSVFAVPVDAAGGETLRFTIRFSMPFTAGAKSDTALRIFLEPFFPGVLDPVALRFVSWLSDDRLRMEWEGVESGAAGVSHYFRLNFPGGKGGINNGGGMYLKEDQALYLEAIK
ncbi:MAG: Ig-like domain-containing protein [Treponema sp.]|jgi:hypothetical protein|nr:Ig-like domain-containing protein [Treponema sp.]